MILHEFYGDMRLRMLTIYWICSLENMKFA